MRTARAKLLAAVVVASGLVALLASGAASASGSPLTGQWNRLSVDRSHPAPEHELLRCVENNGAAELAVLGLRPHDVFHGYPIAVKR